MIPQGGTINNALMEQRQQPSLTWALDFDRGRVAGRIDGIAAVKQAVYKALQTDRFWYDIYSANYGHELRTLLGKSPLYVQAEASRMVSEALLQDDRIKSVEGLSVHYVGEQLTVQFTVVTDQGKFEEEVTIGV